MAAETGNAHIFDTTTDIRSKLQRGKSRVFDHDELVKCISATVTMTDTRKLNYRCFEAIPGISGCPSLFQSFVDTFTELVMVPTSEVVVGSSEF